MSDDQQIEELQGDIEQTRSDLSSTLSQIEQRLSPSALGDQASDIVKQVTDQILAEFSGRSGELTSKINEQVQTAIQGVATSRAEQLLAQAGPAFGTAGKSLWGRISSNPAVGALAAVGIGLLAAEESARRSSSSTAPSGGASSSSNGGSAVSGLTSTISGLAGQASEAVGGLVDSAKQQAQGIAPSGSSSGSSSGSGSTSGGMGSMITDQGVSSGLLAMGLGFLVGVAAPSSEAEQQAVAPLRDKARDQLDQMGLSGGSGQGLLDQAKQAGGDLLGQARQSATGAVDQAKQTAGEVGKSVAETAKQASQGGSSTSS